MATLTETAYFTRKGVKIFAGVIVAIIVLRFLWSMAVGVWLSIFPPPPTPPTLGYGYLPTLNISQVASPSGKITYTLETVSGKLPTLPYTMKVYFMPKSGSSFTKDETMRTKASLMGFQNTGAEIAGQSNKWLFTDKSYPLRFLEYDATRNYFNLTYDYKNDLNVFVRNGFTDKSKIISDAVDYFGSLGLLQSDLDVVNPTVTLYKLDGTSLVPTSSLFETDAAKVLFKRKDIVEGKIKYPVVGDFGLSGNVSVLLNANQNKAKKILEAKYRYQEVSFTNFETYTLVPIKTAWSLLEQNEVYFQSLPKNFNGGEIAIRNIYLAYFDGGETQKYLQPVIVFTDSQDFIAYVPAIDPKYLKSKN